MPHRGDVRVSACQQILRKVCPRGIHGFNQPDFSRTIPFLYLTLSGNRTVRVLDQFEIDKSLDITISGEAGNQTIAMLKEPANEIRGHARVHRAGAVGQDVDVEGTLSTHCGAPF